MAQCELCGRHDNLTKTLIESTLLNACTGCSKLGKIVEQPSAYPNFNVLQKEKIIDDIAPNYSELISKKRQQLSLTHRELAEKLKEKEALIAKIEKAQLKPSLELAKKIEKFLNIKLIVEDKIVSSGQKQKNNSEAATIGDFIKL